MIPSEFLKLPIIVLVLGTTYAIIRYHIFADVSLEHLPLYVLNKGISVGALVLLVMSRFHEDSQIRRYRGLAGFSLALLHVLISIPILHPAYFGKLFLRSGSMNLKGELCILAGILGFALLSWLWSRSPGAMPGRVLKLALLMVALHSGILGYNHWLQPQRWPGHLPPITLISSLVALAGTLWPKRYSKDNAKTEKSLVIPLRLRSQKTIKRSLL